MLICFDEENICKLILSEKKFIVIKLRFISDFFLNRQFSKHDCFQKRSFCVLKVKNECIVFKTIVFFLNTKLFIFKTTDFKLFFVGICVFWWKRVQHILMHWRIVELYTKTRLNSKYRKPNAVSPGWYLKCQFVLSFFLLFWKLCNISNQWTSTRGL